MLIYKNRSSGKYFICIEKTGDDEVLLVTPQSEIKSLKLHLFESPEEKEENYLISNGIITEKQLSRWKQYLEDRSEDKRESLEILFKEFSPSQQKQILEDLKKDLNTEKS